MIPAVSTWDSKLNNLAHLLLYLHITLMQTHIISNVYNQRYLHIKQENTFDIELSKLYNVMQWLVQLFTCFQFVGPLRRCWTACWVANTAWRPTMMMPTDPTWIWLMAYICTIRDCWSMLVRPSRIACSGELWNTGCTIWVGIGLCRLPCSCSMMQDWSCHHHVLCTYLATRPDVWYDLCVTVYIPVMPWALLCPYMF